MKTTSMNLKCFCLVWLHLFSTATLAVENTIEIKLLTEPVKLKQLDNQTLLAGEAFRIGFQITHSSTGEIISNLHPRAWIRPRLPGRKTCDNAIRNYLLSGTTSNQDIDLNGFTFITLNADHSVAVIDPKLNLATSNLLKLIPFNSAPGEWKINPDNGKIYISLPEKNQLIIINTYTGTIESRIPLSPKPIKIIYFPKQPLVWVVSQKDGNLQAIDVVKNKVLQSIKIGKGTVYVSTDNVNQRIFVYASQSGLLSVVDAKQQKLLIQGKIQKGLMGIGYSQLSKRLFLGNPQARKLLSVYPEKDFSTQQISLEGSSKQVKITADGKWVFALDGQQGLISIIDPVKLRMSHALRFKHSFDQLVFSNQYAYVRHTDNAQISLVNIATLTEDQQPNVMEVPFGAHPPLSQQNIASFPVIAPLAHSGKVIVINPADKMIFLHMEDGMQAPANAFKTYTAAPISIYVRDQSLKESNLGLYETTTLVNQSGAYEVVFYLKNPLHTQCLPIEIKGNNSNSDSIPLKKNYHLELNTLTYSAEEPVTLKLILKNQNNRMEKIQDLRVLLFQTGSNWQYRDFAKATAEGYYQITVKFPRQGQYKMAVESSQLGIHFSPSQMKTIEVKN